MTIIKFSNPLTYQLVQTTMLQYYIDAVIIGSTLPSSQVVVRAHTISFCIVIHSK